jgi:uncharacterized membrane protein YccC
MESIDAIATDQWRREEQEPNAHRDGAPTRRPASLISLSRDLPFCAMLLIALAGVGLHMPVGYWVLLTPVFGIICVIDDILSEV